MKTPKIVLEQIDKAANPKRDLGLVKTTNSIAVNYKDPSDVSDENLVDLKWKKRYYSYDRGLFCVLDIDKFTNFFGKIYRTEVNGQYGNFVDFLGEPHSNVQYSTSVYVNQDVVIDFSLSISYGSVAIYNNHIEIYSSPEDNYYISAQHSLFLQKGWNVIDVFLYRQRGSAKVVIDSNLAKKITSWKSVDFDPPSPPAWYSTPIETEYVDPTNKPELQNVIRWINSKYTNKYEDVRGWGLYRYETDLVKAQDGSEITIVSGWGDYGFIVDGDRRDYFPSQLSIGPGYATFLTVSGTEYHSGDDETLVILSGTGYNMDLFAGLGIGRKIYRHLKDIEWDMSLGSVVSGTDVGVTQGKYYSYALDTFDGSSNRNRSEKSTIQTLFSGDFTAPPKLTSNDIIISNGTIKRVWARIKNPYRWENMTGQNDVRGVRVWTSANPGYPRDNYLVGDFPINVSGTSTLINIDHTISGSTTVPLDDVTEYTFYLSSYDWYGNSTLTNLPSFTATTSVDLSTGSNDTKIKIESSTNSIRLYVDSAQAV